MNEKIIEGGMEILAGNGNDFCDGEAGNTNGPGFVSPEATS
ncbi:MAG: hypothetical protein UX38_C0004G0009 [Microgenomates group bacterium GW2011_GWC1_46_16]|nr:MAG: hypothetical protein UX32_C0009G0005 [Microgenomates group bacterium GW2011_GWF1_46_12]KKU26629.1 MAG: hypothetical protein UX38_C0004G0009 [Microgenomates group bacterium GW2011_GWC1_46_16]KKU45463.1 MAG: hypothetical protein UX63_C0005G0015 [Microgenomates group bacterium GW2011_GWB1_46_7]